MSELGFRGECPGCDALKFVDASNDIVIPEGWLLSKDQEIPASGIVRARCPKCPKVDAKDDLPEAVAHATYGDTESLGEARAEHANAHICLVCAHLSVCKYTPDEEGVAMLVTISRCGGFVPDLDSEEV